MKIIKILGICGIFLICTHLTMAKKVKDTDIPPWMEKIKVKGNNNYFLPKGTKRKKVGTQIVTESVNEYAARRIFEIEKSLKERLDKIDKQQKDFQEGVAKELEEIKKELLRLQTLIEPEAQE